jgi:glycosyltransferase involved in cell wall biosynthesis
MPYKGIKSSKTVVVMPAYNAGKTLEKTVRDIPPGSADEIILVDDASKDDTSEVAAKLGLKIITHPKNLGYGGNQKTCYRAALAEGADIVVMLHPDYQYDPRLVPFFTGLIREGICDVVFGNRIRTRAEALRGGMPLYKYIFNRMLTMLENLFLGLNLGEYHTGYRAFSRKVLENIPWENNSNDFVFDQEMIFQIAYYGFKIGDIPVPAKYFREASSINFTRSMKYGLETLWTLLKFILAKSGIARPAIFNRAKK